MKKLYLLLLVLVMLLVSCKKDRDVEFTTFEIVDEKFTSSYTSVDLSCKVRCAATIKELYLQYDTVADFSTYQEVTLTENEKTKGYSVKIGDLLDNTTYYVRYVAVNSYSQVTSEEVSGFKTLKAVKPTIEIKEVTNVLDKTVTIKVVLKSDGGAPISKMGVCWSTKSAPTIQDEVVEIKNSSMSIPLSGLTSNTTYFVRAFAENKSGLAYSVDESFLTLDLPKVKTDNVSDIEITSVVLNGELLFNGNDLTTVCGFCWSRADNSEFEDSIQVSKETKFSYQISNLQDETQYRVRAYAKNKIGVTYGEILTFKTQSPLLPSVVTSDVKSISYTTATVEANVTSDGGADVMERGVCYSTSKDPTINNEVVQYGKGIGKFSVSLKDLIAGKTYYVRAYAKNKKGVAYGSSLSFTTLEYGLPIVETLAVTNISFASATVGGSVVSDGGLNIIARGICYSLNENPTINDRYIVSGDGLGKFTINLEGLTDETTYYIRAYAKNSNGIAYGEQISFTTLGESVDLGLSVRWAACNLGATSPEGYGKYYAWGETAEKSYYDWSTYKYSNYNESSQKINLTKYCFDSYYGNNFSYQDSRTVLEKIDDAAYMNLGGDWRMPTYDEFSELINYCTWTWTTQNGVQGYVVKSKRNGNSIFLPTAGYKNKLDLGGGGHYWTSRLTTIFYPGFACACVFYSDEVRLTPEGSRDYGYSIRPVTTLSSVDPTPKSYTIAVYSHDNSRGTVSGGGTYAEGSQVTITATAKSGYKFKEWNDGNTDNPRVITVMKDAIYTAHFEEEKNLNAGHEYVDLGLPSGLKWATCNVGANSSGEYGDYFAWGETQPKNYYTQSTYKYGYMDDLWKYCTDSRYGTIDNKTVLDPEDDVAVANWGSSWRMPTKAEMTELYEKCTLRWTYSDGSYGCEVKGPNGNTIFLPASGYKDGNNYYDTDDAFYLTSSLATRSDFVEALQFGLNVSGVFYNQINGPQRYVGCCVRPVHGESSQQPEIKRYTISVYSHDNSRGTVSGGGTYPEGSQVTITATAKSGYKFKEWNDGNTDNPRVITVVKDAIYTAHFEAEKNLNAGHEYVDLGLPSGLKWATCNVGATTPEEYGDYFAWGEVEPKTTYNWSTYKYSKESYKTMTKYCTNSSYGNGGFSDNKTVLDPIDDAATANWGGAWRMPTEAEQDELRNNCTWTWTTQNGVDGYEVIGPNGNSIFLPAAGYMLDTSLNKVGSYGYYWSSSLSMSDPYDAYSVYFWSSSVSGYIDYRLFGLSVRPVCQ